MVLEARAFCYLSGYRHGGDSVMRNGLLNLFGIRGTGDVQ